MAELLSFVLNEDQRQLQDGVARFVREHYRFEAWKAAARSADGWRPALWQQMADLGWLGMALPESHGGMGWGLREQALAMEGIGQGLVLEPFWSTAVLGSGLLLAAGTPAQCERWLPGMARGELRLAAALLEPARGFDWQAVQVQASRSASGWRLSGRKLTVLDAPLAQRLLVSARTGPQPDEVSLFCVDAQAPGIKRQDFMALDERRCADIEFCETPVVEADRLAGTGGTAAWQQAIDHALVALAAEAVGAMSAVLRITIDYLKTRRQFGRPLSEFQALRHRVADMVMATEQTRSLVWRAAGSARGEMSFTRLAAAAKVQAGQAGRFVGESAVQLHGGIGVTDELVVGHYLKRLMVSDILLGDAPHHLARFASLDSQAPLR